MTTWDDKPNDYQHSLEIIDRLHASNEALVETLEEVEWWLSTVSNSRQYFRAKLRAVLAAAKGEK
jgi:hypothetical protein